LQNGVAGVFAQSLFCRQLAHISLEAQKGVGARQSGFDMQATHSPLPVSQTGLSPEQLAFDVQPLRHRRSWASQMGVEPLQSALLVHCTHSPVGRQIGALAAQSELPRHATHVAFCVLQSGVGVAQSAFFRHCPQAPVLGSHWGVGRGHATALVPVHDAWHW
jgi:hypothetical protein